MDLSDEALLDMDLLADDGSDDEGDAPVSSGPASTPTSSTSSPPQGMDEPSSPHASWNSGLFGSGPFFGGSSLNSTNTFGRYSFSSKRGPGRPRKEGVKSIREGKVVRKYRVNTNQSKGFKIKHRGSRDDSLEDLFEEEAQLLLASTAAPEEPPYFPEKWPGKVCALCNLSERSQLGQGEMQRYLCSAVPVVSSPPYMPATTPTDNSSTTVTSAPNSTMPPIPTFRRQKSLYKCKVPSSNPEHTDELSIIGHMDVVDLSVLVDNCYIYVHKNCLDWSTPVETRASAPSTPSEEKLSQIPSNKEDTKDCEEAASGIVVAGVHKKCSFCQRYGASISCKMSCNKYFHYPCVLASGGFQHASVKASFCKDHVYQVPLICPAGVECRSCNVIGDISNLMTCCSCNAHYHGLCVGLSQLPGVRAGWNCKECRVCQICHIAGTDTGESRSIACEQCEKLYHVGCIRPIMATVPKYGWKCKCCRVCSDCGSRSPGAGASSRWHAHYTVCDSCYQQRNKGLSCPICRRAYRAAHQREMVRCTQCNKYVHGACDPDAEVATYQMKKESMPDYEYTCPACVSSGAATQKRKESIDEESLSASQESLFEDVTMEQDPLDTSKMSIGLGKGKPFSASSKIAKKKLGVFKFKSGYGNSAGKLAFSKRQKSMDLSRRRGSKSKMLGVFGVPGQGLQRPQAQDKEGEDEPGVENKLVLCSSKDKFVLSQDLCVMCGALGTDSEGCLIACAQCGQTYHPYCVSVKLSSVIVLKGWRCLDCTVCEGCGRRDDEARLVLCDDCDVSYHTYCAQPPLSDVPRGCWRCSRCRRCHTCGTTDPGSDANWSNGYTECGPCGSLVMCPVCAAPYSDGELIIQCARCKRWLHAACDTIHNEQEADTCCQKGYNCLLCRPPEAPPPHLIPSPCPTPTPPVVLPPPPQPTVIPQRPPSPCGDFYLDGVCLSAGGMRAMRSLQGDLAASQGGLLGQRKKRKLKGDGGVLAAIESVVQGGDCEGDDKMDPMDIKEEPGASQYKDGMIWSVAQDGPVPEGFTLFTSESGQTVLRKKRQRNLNKVGIGGFSVRVRAQGNRTPTPAEADPATTPTTPTGQNPSESPGLSKKKPRRKPRSRLMEAFPSYMQEAFFGRDLLDMQTLLDTKESVQSDSDGERQVACPTIHLNEEELQAIEVVRIKEEKEEKDKASELKAERQIKLETENINGDMKHHLVNDEVKVLKEVMHQSQGSGNSSAIMSVPGADVKPIIMDPPLKDVPMNKQTSEMVGSVGNKEDLSLFESMVRETLHMDGRDVEEMFKGVLTDDSQESQESSVSFVNSVNGSGGFNPQRQHLSSPIEFPSPYHTEYNSGNSQLSPAYSENSGPWMGTQQDSIDSSTSQQMHIQPTHTSTYNQRSTEKMKADESLGTAATISAVLYANINHPEWMTEYPNWPDRCKQILKKWRALPSDKKTPYLQQARDNRGAIRMKKARQISKEEGGATTHAGEAPGEGKVTELQPIITAKAQPTTPTTEVPQQNKDGLTPPTNQNTPISTSNQTPTQSTSPPVTRTNNSSVVTLHHGFTPFYHGSEGPAPNVTVNPFGKFTLAGHKSAVSVGVGVVQRPPSPPGDPHIRVLTPSEIMRTLPSLPQELALETTSRSTEQEKVAIGQRGAKEAEQERQWKLLQQQRQQQAQQQQQVIHDQRIQAMARVQRQTLTDSSFPDGQLHVAVNEQSPLHSVASPSPTLPRSPYPPAARFPHPLLVQVRPPAPSVQHSVRSPFSPQSPHEQFPGSVSPAQSQGDPFQRPPSENSGDYMHSPQTPRSFGHQSPNPARSPAYVGQARMVPIANQEVFVPTPGTPRSNTQYSMGPQRNQIYAPRPQDPFLPGQSQPLNSPRSDGPIHQPMEVNRQLRDLLQRQQTPNKLWQDGEQNVMGQTAGQMVVQGQLQNQVTQQQMVVGGGGPMESGQMHQQPDGQFRQPLPVSPVIRQRPPMPNAPMDARARLVLQQPIGVNTVPGQGHQIQQRLLSHQMIRTRPPVQLDNSSLQQAQQPATLSLHHAVQGKKVVHVNAGGQIQQVVQQLSQTQQVQTLNPVPTLNQAQSPVGQIRGHPASVESAVVMVPAGEEKHPNAPVSTAPTVASSTQEDVPDVDIDKLEHDTANMAEVGDLLGGLDDDEQLLVQLTEEMGDDFNILEYADPELADFGDTSHILDGLELADEEPSAVGQHTKRDLIDEPEENKLDTVKVEPNIVKAEKKEEDMPGSETKTVKVEPGLEVDNNLTPTSQQNQQVQLQQPKQEVMEGELMTQDVMVPRLDIAQPGNQGTILTQNQAIRLQQLRSEQGMQQQQLQGQAQQGQIQGQQVYTTFAQRVPQRQIGQILNINQQGQINQLGIQKQGGGPNQQQIITQGQHIIRQVDPNQMEQGGKQVQFVSSQQQIRGHFNQQGKPFSQVIQQQQSNNVVQQMQSQVSAALAMGRPMAPGTKLMSPDGAVGVVTHNNTVTLTYPPQYLNRGQHHGQIGVRGVARAAQPTPPPPPYPGTAPPRLQTSSTGGPSLPPPPPPYPSQVCGLEYGAEPWNDWLRRRPLLLQEQPLLLEDLLEQEKREQGGAGDVVVPQSPVPNAPHSWQQPTQPPAPPQPQVGTVPLFNVPVLPAPPVPPERMITEADRQAHMLYEEWLKQQNVILGNQLKYYDTEVQKLRKIRKSLNSKQRQLRKGGNELTVCDATELARVTGEQAILQKHLESARKQCRQHGMLMQEYHNKHKLQQPQMQQQPVGGIVQQQTMFGQQQVIGNISRISPQGTLGGQQNQGQFTQHTLVGQQQRINQAIQQNQLQQQTQLIQNQQLQNPELQNQQRIQNQLQNQQQMLTQQLQNQQQMQTQQMQNQQQMQTQQMQNQQQMQTQQLQNQQQISNQKTLQQLQSQLQNQSNQNQNDIQSQQQQLQNAQIQQIQQQLMSSHPSPQMSNVSVQNQVTHTQQQLVGQHMQQIVNASPQHPMVSPGPQHSIVSPGAQQHSIVSPGPQQHSIVSPGPQQRSIVSPGPQQHSIVSPGPQQQPIVSPGPQQRPLVSPGPQQHSIVSPSPQQHPIVSPGPQHSIVSPGPNQVIGSSPQHQSLNSGPQQQLINSSPQHQMVSPGPQQHSILSPGSHPQQQMMNTHQIMNPNQQMMNAGQQMMNLGQQMIGGQQQRHLVSPGPNQMIINNQPQQMVNHGVQHQQQQRAMSTPSPQMGMQMQNIHSPVTSHSPQLQSIQNGSMSGGASPIGAGGTPPPPFSPSQPGSRSPQVMFHRPPSQAPQARFARPPQHHNIHHQGMRVQFSNRQSSPLGSPQPLMSPGGGDPISRQQMMQRQQYSPMGQPPSSPMARSPLVSSVPSPSPPQGGGGGNTNSQIAPLLTADGGGGGSPQVAPLPPELGRYRYFKLGLRGGSPGWGLNKPPNKPEALPTQGSSQQSPAPDTCQVSTQKKELHISKVSILKKKPPIKISSGGGGGTVQLSAVKSSSLVINTSEFTEVDEHASTPPVSPGKMIHSVEASKATKSPIKTVKVLDKKTADCKQHDEDVVLIDSSPDENKQEILDYDDENDKTFVGAEVSLCTTAGDSDHVELSMLEEFPSVEISDIAGSPLDPQDYVLFSTDGVDYNVDSEDESLKQLSFIQKDNGVVVSYTRQTPESNGESNIHSPGEVSEDDCNSITEDVNEKASNSPATQENTEESAIVIISSNVSPEEHIATTEEDFEELIDSGKPEDTPEEDTNKKSCIEKPPVPVTTAESQTTTITRTETTKKTVAVISLGSKTPQAGGVQQFKLVNTGKAPSGITRLPLLGNNLVISPSSNTKILNEVSQATVASVSIANQTISVPVLKSLNVPINQLGSGGSGSSMPSVSHIKKVPITKPISSVISVISSNIPRVASLSPVITLTTSTSGGVTRMPIPILTQQHIKQKFSQNIEKTMTLPTTNISTLSVSQDTTLPANIFQDDSTSPDNSSQEDSNEGNKEAADNTEKVTPSAFDGNKNLTKPPSVVPTVTSSSESNRSTIKLKTDVDIESEISTHTELPQKMIASIVMSKSDIISKPPERVPETIPDNIMEGDDEDKASIKSDDDNESIVLKSESKDNSAEDPKSGTNSIDDSNLAAIKTVENDSKDISLDSKVRLGSSDVSQESIQISIPSPTPSQEQYLDSISLPGQESDTSTVGTKKVELTDEMLDMLNTINRDSKRFPMKIKDHADSSQESTSTTDKEHDSMSDLDDIIRKDLVSSATPEPNQDSAKSTIPVHVIMRSRESSPIRVATATSRVTTIMPQLSPLSKPAELTSNIDNVSQQLRTIMSSLNTTKVETSVSQTIKKIGGDQDSNQSAQVNYENLLPSTKVEVAASKSNNRGLMEKAVINSMNSSMPESTNNTAIMSNSRINSMIPSNIGMRSQQSPQSSSPSSSPRHSPLLPSKSPVQSPLVSNQSNIEDQSQMPQQIVQMPALSKIQPGGMQPMPSVIQTNQQTPAALHKTLISTNILSSTLMQSRPGSGNIQVSVQNISSSQPPALIMTSRPVVSIHSQHLTPQSMHQTSIMHQASLSQPVVSKVQMGSVMPTSKLLHSQLTSPLKRSKSTDEPKREVVVGPIQPTKRHSLESVIVKSEPMECEDNSSGPLGIDSISKVGNQNAPHKTDDSQNVLLKQLLQNSGASSPVPPRTVASLLTCQRPAPSLGIVPSLEAQLARPLIPPAHLHLVSSGESPRISPRPTTVTRETQSTSRPTVGTPMTVNTATVTTHSALMDIRKPLTKTVRDDGSVNVRDITPAPVTLPTSAPSAFSLISTEIATQNIKKEVAPPQQSPVSQSFISQEIKKELIDDSSQQSTLSGVSAVSDQGKPDIKEEVCDVPPTTADVSTENGTVPQETPQEAKKRKRREYQQKRRLMQINMQKAEAANNNANNLLANNNLSNKKKPRKASKVEEDYDTFIDNLMIQLRQLQPMQVQEPILSKNYGVCPVVGTGDFSKIASNKEYNFKFGDLFGDFGSARIPNIANFYNTKPFGEEEPIPEKPPVSTQRGFYDQEFSPIRLDMESDEKKIEFLCRERDMNTPDTIISSSSPECSQWDDPHPFPGLKLIDEDSDSEDEKARSNSPVVPLIAPVPIRLRPLAPIVSDKDNDKENNCNNANKEAVSIKSKVMGPGADADNNENVTVTLTLTSGAAEDILGVLRKLAGFLHIPPPTAYQIVERTATPPSHKLGLYRIKGKDGKEGTPIDIQSILNGGAKFCRHCDIVILDSVIRAKASEFPLLTSSKSNSDLLNDVDSELYFCSTQCYKRFAWRPTNILLDNKIKQFDDDKNLVPLLDMKERDETDTNSAESMETDDLDIKPDTDKMDFLFSDALGDDLIKQENDESKVKTEDNKSKLTDASSGPPAKQFRGQQYKVWSPGCIVPSSRYKKPTDRELTELVYRTGIALTPTKMPEDYRKCVLCHSQGDGVADGPSRLLNYEVDKWVHLNCALWSDGVYETVNGALMNFENALQSGMSTTCVSCQKTGATVRCFKTRCSSVYHLNCAVKDNCVFHKNKTAHCASHAPKGEKENELTTLSVQRRVYVQRDESRQVAAVMQLADLTHLLRVGGLIFLSVGQLLPHQLATHHTPNFIYPVGYKIVRFYWSMKKFNARCCYICHIEDDGGRPEFIVSCQEDGPAQSINGTETTSQLEWRGPTPRAAWGPVLDALEKLRKDHDCLRLWPDHITGEDLFGLTEPAIVRVLESLPGIDTLTDYRFKYGRNPLLELPLAVNPSGAARTEARSVARGAAWRRALAVRATHPHPHPTPARSSQPPPLAPPPPPPPPGDLACPYSKQFVHSKSSQYKKMKQEWRNNVYLARSKIQGLGLYAARDLEKHTMVIEYIGEVIRHELSEIREKKYEDSNRGIYMFRLDEERVVDATLCGGLARYINHSCNPNCVAEAVEVERDTRIIIFAKRRILRGEELAYDYKFDIEDDAHKISCMCGAPNCRKWMN